MLKNQIISLILTMFKSSGKNLNILGLGERRSMSSPLKLGSCILAFHICQITIPFPFGCSLNSISIKDMTRHRWVKSNICGNRPVDCWLILIHICTNTFFMIWSNFSYSREQGPCLTSPKRRLNHLLLRICTCTFRFPHYLKA